MKQYLTYFKLRIITNLQYRMDAIAGIATQIFFGLISIMIYNAFYSSSASTPPMTYKEIASYLWLSQAFYALIYPYLKDQELLSMIKNGNLAYELVRPQNFYLKWYIKLLSKRLVNMLLRFAPVIIIAILLPAPYNLSAPSSLANFLIFILALILSLFLMTSLCLIIHLITMFTIEERGPMTIYSVIAEVFMGAAIPIPFLPIWMQKICVILPFRYISDFPFRVYTNSITITESIPLLISSFIWIIITVLIGYIISKFSLKKAVIQGG